MNHKVTAWRASFGSARRELSNPLRLSEIPDLVEFLWRDEIITGATCQGVSHAFKGTTREGYVAQGSQRAKRVKESALTSKDERTIFTGREDNDEHLLSLLRGLYFYLQWA